MAKEMNFNELVQTLQDAQQNKTLLETLATSLEKYVDGQQKSLDDLRSLISQAKAGKLQVKKKGGYRGRKSKSDDGGVE